MNVAIALCFLLTASSAWSQCDPEEVFGNTTSNAVCTEFGAATRVIYANSLPDHETGAFPNPGNPNSIRAQRTTKTMCTYPQFGDELTWIDQQSGNCPFWVFGIAVNGLEFDPIANEFFENPDNGQLNREWNENALSDNINLGLDINDAHVQPTGKYHYHGDPVKYIESLGISPEDHSPVIGYAADGFPIYYRYVTENNTSPDGIVIEIASGWTLKEGNRPGDGTTAPDGAYDGTYTQDYEYTGSTANGGLDECNGRYGITFEYPQGTYYYVITAAYPVIPRCFKGIPDRSFTIGPPPAGCGVSNADEICTVTSVTEDPAQMRNSIEVFPSPASSVVSLRVSNEELVHHLERVTILNSEGRIMHVQTGLQQVDVDAFSAGMYYIQFDFGDTTVMKPLAKN